MKCFIHIDKEAISVCKKCGKAMCADCSAYSSHSGICPECRRDDFVQEKNTRRSQADELKKERLGVIFLWFVLPLVAAILLSVWIPSILVVFIVAALVAVIVGIVKVVRIKNKIGEHLARIEKLTPEIERLNKVLGSRGGNAFL